MPIVIITAFSDPGIVRGPANGECQSLRSPLPWRHSKRLSGTYCRESRLSAARDSVQADDGLSGMWHAATASPHLIPGASDQRGEGVRSETRSWHHAHVSRRWGIGKGQGTCRGIFTPPAPSRQSVAATLRGFEAPFGRARSFREYEAQLVPPMAANAHAHRGSARYVESPVGGGRGGFPGPWTFACRRASISPFASSSRKYFTRSRMRPQAWGLRHSLGDNDHAWRQGDSQGHLLRSYAASGDRSESPWAVDGTVRRGGPLLPRDGGAAQPISGAGRRARGPVDGGSALGGRGAERRFMTRRARTRRLSTRRRRLA